MVFCELMSSFSLSVHVINKYFSKSSYPFSSIQTDVCVTIIQHIFVLFLTFTCFTSLCFCVQVVVPTRVGQVYVYDSVKPGQDEYDVPPRHQPPTQQDIYDVPPTRQQYNTQVRLVCVCVSVCLFVSSVM